MSKTIPEMKRDVPVVAEVDVLVCGGGPAGFSAAVAAARLGAKVLLVEQTNCLGGIATAGGHGHICLYTEWGTSVRVVGGVPYEIARRVVAGGWGDFKGDGSEVDFQIDAMKLVLEQLAGEAGVRLLYHTLFADAIVEGGRVAGAFLQNKSGRQAVRAKRVIDATGDADVAASAGVRCETGRPGDGACQPATLMFTLGGVDWSKVKAWRTCYQMKEVWAKAQAAGDMEPFQSVIMGWWWTPTRPDQVGQNFTHMVGVDATSAESVTQATIEGRRQAFAMIPVFRKYVPGMEECHLVSTAALLGTRESRRIAADTILSERDIMARRAWDDAVCYGSFYVDVHNCTGPGMDAETWYPPKGFRYQIPYGVLLPAGTDGLLVAGRCVGVTHRALGSTRVMPQCGALGEAAGAAAALSLRQGCSPRDLPVGLLQDQLRRQGAIFDEAGIEATRPAHKEGTAQGPSRP